MLTTNRPHKIFNNRADAEAMIVTMGFEAGETHINEDPKGSGRCFVDVLDLEDGEVIGRI